MSMVLDGQVVSAFRDPLKLRKAGTIQFGFYVPGVLEFRKIEIEEFSAVEPAVAGFTPLFNGKDRTGWNLVPDTKGKWGGVRRIVSERWGDEARGGAVDARHPAGRLPRL